MIVYVRALIISAMVSEYEQQRLARIAANNAKLVELGLDQRPSDLPPPRRKHTATAASKMKKRPAEGPPAVAPRRVSSRAKGLDPEGRPLLPPAAPPPSAVVSAADATAGVVPGWAAREFAKEEATARGEAAAGGGRRLPRFDRRRHHQHLVRSPSIFSAAAHLSNVAVSSAGAAGMSQNSACRRPPRGRVCHAAISGALALGALGRHDRVRGLRRGARRARDRDARARGRRRRRRRSHRLVLGGRSPFFPLFLGGGRSVSFAVASRSPTWAANGTLLGPPRAHTLVSSVLRPSPLALSVPTAMRAGRAFSFAAPPLTSRWV